MIVMADPKPTLPFLVLTEYHLSAEKARQAVIDTCTRCGMEPANGNWDKTTVNWEKTDPPFSMEFPEMVKEARRTGIVRLLQRHLDTKDGVFGGGNIEDLCTPNFQMTLTADIGGFKGEVQGPCRTSLVEKDLTDDILFYRRLVCQHSNEYDFELSARYYRNYLSACTSIVDAFVNRHILIASSQGFTSPEFEQLRNATKVETRLELWWRVCVDSDPSPLFKSVQWNHFHELRTKRNEILHAVDPIGLYSIPRMQEFLNKVRTGVGGLMLLMRKAHNKPSLGFIERLRTAPRVEYHQIHLHVDGDRCVRVHRGQ